MMVQNTHIHCTQFFADDHSSILKAEESHIRAFMEVFDKFCEVSGLKMSTGKTEARWLWKPPSFLGRQSEVQMVQAT